MGGVHGAGATHCNHSEAPGVGTFLNDVYPSCACHVFCNDVINAPSRFDQTQAQRFGDASDSTLRCFEVERHVATEEIVWVQIPQ